MKQKPIYKIIFYKNRENLRKTDKDRDLLDEGEPVCDLILQRPDSDVMYVPSTPYFLLFRLFR